MNAFTQVHFPQRDKNEGTGGKWKGLFRLYFQQFIGYSDILNPQTYFLPFDEMR